MSHTDTEHRKLAAIMFTDMVGYRAVAERNEAPGWRHKSGKRPGLCLEFKYERDTH